MAREATLDLSPRMTRNSPDFQARAPPAAPDVELMLWGGRTLEPRNPLALALRWEPRKVGERDAPEAAPLPRQVSTPNLVQLRDFLQRSGHGEAKGERREGAGGLGARGGSPFSGTPRGAASQWDLHTRGVTALLR